MSLFSVKGSNELKIDNIVKDIQEAFEVTADIFVKKEDGIQRGRKKKFHDSMQSELVALAHTYSLLGYKEFLVKEYEEGRNGYIDVVWRDANGIKLLLEIDSSPRSKSVKKLLSGTSEYKIWLYYGSKSAEEVLLLDKEEQIYLIHRPI